MTGLVDEGMECVEAVRRRYDGERRNPWNEFECGSNYARSMASYALLNAFSGFEFDLVNRRLGFNPLYTEEGRFRCFWSLDPGWGEFVLTPEQAELRLLYGSLPVESLSLPFLGERAVRQVSVDGAPVSFTRTADGIRLDAAATLSAGQALQVALT
jgi:hypothetical protein